MCLMCDWGTEELYGEEVPDNSEAALERKRASQDSWARLMEEIARADAAAEAARQAD